jgi:hypothetical protein
MVYILQQDIYFFSGEGGITSGDPSGDQLKKGFATACHRTISALASKLASK